jgi:hypothetical protein
MTEYFADDPAPPEQRITELHAWIATQGNDGEGIIGAIVGGVYVPLVSSKKHLHGGKHAAYLSRKDAYPKAHDLGVPTMPLKQNNEVEIDLNVGRMRYGILLVAGAIFQKLADDAPRGSKTTRDQTAMARECKAWAKELWDDLVKSEVTSIVDTVPVAPESHGYRDARGLHSYQVRYRDNLDWWAIVEEIPLDANDLVLVYRATPNAPWERMNGSGNLRQVSDLSNDLPPIAATDLIVISVEMLKTHGMPRDYETSFMYVLRVHKAVADAIFAALSIASEVASTGGDDLEPVARLHLKPSAAALFRRMMELPNE